MITFTYWCCIVNVKFFFRNISINLLSVEPVVFHVFQLMLGKLKSPRNNLYPALLHIRSIREHILRLLSIRKSYYQSGLDWWQSLLPVRKCLGILRLQAAHAHCSQYMRIVDNMAAAHV